ncbi:hypothetical protein [Rhodopirellula europaea]|jgi:hypothetical protein|uniref:Putative membrane protein n=1 Tax=Rhodopirellula europaea SH398 TaxID=1263868 RepID=M5S2I5_9BACT|nr:hypothetical protein [Rhodopirellula europaea]EMI25755.1 putative membrane protein [Rhodopirellula europaea SH398]
MVNPYEAPKVDVVAETTKRPNNPFLIGFRNGTLWSLIVLVLVVPAFYMEFAIPFTQRTTSGLPADRMSWATSAWLWFAACGTGLTFITLPWAIAAGFVKWASERRESDATR